MYFPSGFFWQNVGSVKKNKVPFNGQDYEHGVWNWRPVAIQFAKEVQKNFFITWPSLMMESKEQNLQKLQNFDYLEKSKSFLDKMKNIFYRIPRAIIWWKNKK